MTFYKDLYVSESVGKDADKFKRKIKQNKPLPDVFVIALSNKSGEMLDIIPAWELTQKSYPKAELAIIGLAKGKKQAISLVQTIVEYTFTETGNADVRQFFSNKKEDGLWM